MVAVERRLGLFGNRGEVRQVDPHEFYRIAKVWLPIYEDTSASDFDWMIISALQARLYGKKKRSRHGERGAYRGLLLDVWDRRERGQKFSDIARALGLRAESTARSQYKIATLFITGRFDSGGRARQHAKWSPWVWKSRPVRPVKPPRRGCARNTTNK
jgi:hypothetical protein